jgi:pantoate kinase
MTVGSRAEVFHGNAQSTSGGLRKSDLKMKDGRIISKAASKAAKKSLKQNPTFQRFIDLAKEKAEKKGRFCLSPPKKSKTYKKIIKDSK